MAPEMNGEPKVKTSEPQRTNLGVPFMDSLKGSLQGSSKGIPEGFLYFKERLEANGVLFLGV